MRSLFKLSLAALFVGGLLLLTGRAYADEMAKPELKITGDITSSFGDISFGETNGGNQAGKAYSEFTTAVETNLRFTYGNDELTGIGRIRMRSWDDSKRPSSNVLAPGTANNTTVAQPGNSDLYNELHWHPGANKALDIAFGKFQGQAWSQPFSGQYLLLTDTNIGSASEYWMNWTGIPGIDISFSPPGMEIGVAITSTCRPSCNTAAEASAAGVQSTQTIVPHFTGSFGPVNVRLQLPNSSGTLACSAANTPAGCGTNATASKSVSGSGYSLGVQYAASGLSVGLDVQDFVDAKNSNVATQVKDQDRSAVGLRLDVAGIDVGYFDQTTKPYSGGASTDATHVVLRYTIPVGPGSIIPSYESYTLTKAGVNSSGGVEDVSNTLLSLIGRVGF